MPGAHYPTTGPTAITVRPATKEDAPSTARVWAAAWLDGHRDRVPDDLLAARSPDYFTDTANTMVDATLLAVDGTGRVVGVAITTGAELVQIAVDRNARRSGVGAALLEAVETRIGHTHEQAWLAVVPGNSPARTFYERNGWRDAGPMTYFAPAATGRVPVPVHRYVKAVSSGRTPS